MENPAFDPDEAGTELAYINEMAGTRLVPGRPSRIHLM
jgi:hypothetical protein